MAPRQVTLDPVKVLSAFAVVLGLLAYIWYAGAWKERVDEHVTISESADKKHDAILEKVAESLAVQSAVAADREKRLERKERER